MQKFSVAGLTTHLRRATILSGLVASGIFTSPALATRSVTLSWDASSESLVTGYTIYYGPGSGFYPWRIYLSNASHAVIPDLIEGHTYFFTVTATDAHGQESQSSNEVSYKVPGPLIGLKTIRADAAAHAFVIDSASPSTWTLEASPDLRNWKGITKGTNAQVQVALLISSAPRMRFRLISPVPKVALKTRQVPVKGFPNALYFSVKSGGAIPWQLQSSPDSKHWTTLMTGTNLPLHVAIIPATAPAMFFRLKSE